MKSRGDVPNVNPTNPKYQLLIKGGGGLLPGGNPMSVTTVRLQPDVEEGLEVANTIGP